MSGPNEAPSMPETGEENFDDEIDDDENASEVQTQYDSDSEKR